MIIDNIKKIDVLPEKERDLISSLLDEIREINKSVNNHRNYFYDLTIDWQDYHNEYSPERVDPCPDYYSYYSLVEGNKVIGDKMTIEELDNAIFIIKEFIESIW